MAKIKNLLLQGVSGRMGDFMVYQLNGQTVMRRRAKKRTSITAKASQNEKNFVGVGTTWSRLTYPERAAWGQTALRVPRWGAPAGSPPLSGYQCFSSAATGRQAQSLPISTQAPPVPDLPPLLALPTVTATLSPSVPGGLVLELSCAPFACAVSAFAARPAIPGGRVPDARQCALLRTLPTLASGAASLGDAYVKQWKTPPAGAELFLRLVPVSLLGFRGPAVTVSVIVNAAP